MSQAVSISGGMDGIPGFIVAARSHIEATGQGVAETARVLQVSWDFDEEETARLVHLGLCALLRSDKSIKDGTDEGWTDSRPSVRQVTPRGKELFATLYGKASVPIDAVGGFKTLWTCTLTDLEACAAYSHGLSQTWKQRASAFAGLARLCTEHGAKDVKSLPTKALAEASEWVKEAWG